MCCGFWCVCLDYHIVYLYWPSSEQSTQGVKGRGIPTDACIFDYLFCYLYRQETLNISRSSRPASLRVILDSKTVRLGNRTRTSWFCCGNRKFAFRLWTYFSTSWTWADLRKRLGSRRLPSGRRTATEMEFSLESGGSSGSSSSSCCSDLFLFLSKFVFILVVAIFLFDVVVAVVVVGGGAPVLAAEWFCF